MGCLNVKGDWTKTKQFLTNLEGNNMFARVESYAQLGVAALAAVTPYRTGRTASSWTYEIEENKGNYTINFNNTNVNQGRNIAVLLDSGHGTRNGFYITGRNYIEPALGPVLDKIIQSIKEEVSKL